MEIAAQEARAQQQKLQAHMKRVNGAYQMLAAASGTALAKEASARADIGGLHISCCVKQGACYLPLHGPGRAPTQALVTFRVETCPFTAENESVCRILVWFKEPQSIRLLRQSSRACSQSTDAGLLFPEDTAIQKEVASDVADTVLMQRGMGTWVEALQQIGASKVAEILVAELILVRDSNSGSGSKIFSLHFNEHHS